MCTVSLNLELFCINFVNGRNRGSFASKPAHLRDNGIVSWCCFVNKRQGIWLIDEMAYKKTVSSSHLLHKSGTKGKKQQHYWNAFNTTHTHKLPTNFKNTEHILKRGNRIDLESNPRKKK